MKIKYYALIFCGLIGLASVQVQMTMFKHFRKRTPVSTPQVSAEEQVNKIAVEIQQKCSDLNQKILTAMEKDTKPDFTKDTKQIDSLLDQFTNALKPIKDQEIFKKIYNGPFEQINNALVGVKDLVFSLNVFSSAPYSEIADLYLKNFKPLKEHTYGVGLEYKIYPFLGFDPKQAYQMSADTIQNEIIPQVKEYLKKIIAKEKNITLYPEYVKAGAINDEVEAEFMQQYGLLFRQIDYLFRNEFTKKQYDAYLHGEKGIALLKEKMLNFFNAMDQLNNIMVYDIPLKLADIKGFLEKKAGIGAVIKK